MDMLINGKLPNSLLKIDLLIEINISLFGYFSIISDIFSISNVSLNPTEKCEMPSINPSHLFIYLSIVDSKLILTSTFTLALPSNTPLL